LTDYEAEIQKHQEFSSEMHTRINKLLAERDPLYESKYMEKRGLILAQVIAEADNLERAEARLEHCKKVYGERVRELQALDQAHKDWEPM
jgi:hypothetical protein